MLVLSRRCPRWRTYELLPLGLEPLPLSRVPYRRYSSTGPSPSKWRTWIRLTAVTLTAAAIGAYFRSRQDELDTNLNPFTFAHYRLVSRDQVSSTNSIFTLEPAGPVDNRETYEVAWQTGVWSVMFKQPQLQIGRDYTPLPPIDEQQDSLRFLIRRDPHGEMSRYLHGLQQGSIVELRGPQIECEITPEVDNILFIAGGTGIAPALQAAHVLFRRDAKERIPKIHILWANRKREDCAGGESDTSSLSERRSGWWWPFQSKPAKVDAEIPGSSPTTTTGQNAIVRELEELKLRYPGQISVDYFVDEESTFIGAKEIQTYKESCQSSPGSTKMIIISGPEGFIKYMAGPKVWAHGYELQGPVRGLIQQVGVDGWEVRKL